jgi:NAD(P)-dependent dehydrogenase (short-subunit alcohol dehydrogenase family)
LTPTYSLDGKVALLTGAARGIGFATARLMHARGASIAVVDLDQDQASDAAERIGPRALAVAADVTDGAAMDAAVRSTIDAFGGIDVAVANAGIAPPPRTMNAMGSEAFERVMDVNLWGVWRTVRATLPHVIERQGHMVLIASVYAFANGVMASPYAAAKAGVEALGRSLRLELAPHGASATVGYFGFVDTRMVQDAFEDEVAKRMEDRIPRFLLARIEPADAAAALVRGVERRAPRVIAPARWRPLFALRGILNPALDRLMERDARIADLVRDVDRHPAGDTS